MSQQRSVFKAGDIGELINAMPGLFGFPPDDSLVVLGLRGPRIEFGMRLDLADVGRTKAKIAQTADLAVSHLEHQGVEGAIVVAIGEPLAIGRRLVLTIESRLERVRPVAGGWATNNRFWVSMDGGDPDGYPYQRSLDHPASVQAVVEGQEIALSRQAAEAALTPVDGARRAELEAVAEVVVAELGGDLAAGSDPWMADRMANDVVPTLHDLRDGQPVGDDQLLRLGLLMTAIRVRDQAWSLISLDNARDLVRVWLHVARHVPRDWAPPAFSLAAFAAWMCGDGAKAIMAAEQALQIDSRYSMAALMIDLATSGVAPQRLPRMT
ncbi:MAG: DUF4192 domain-containing protein [Aeromicrobium sp.]